MMMNDCGIRQKKFHKTIVSVFIDDEDKGQIDQASAGLIPDGYKICEECQTITVYEVEDTNPLTISKLEKYVHLWLSLDSCFWVLLLCVVDRYGHNRRWIDLCDCFYAMLPNVKQNGACA